MEGEISTFGWDTAFAVRIENVNKAIKSRGVSPKNFKTIDQSDAMVYCQGDFDDWSIVRGGDGGGVNVKIPILNITGQYKAGTGYISYSCKGASIIVTVRLNFFSTGDKQKSLKINPVSTTPDIPVVELYSADFHQNPVVPASAVYVIQGAIMGWCENNLDDFKHIFSIVDINDEADQGAWAFLKPTEVSYAYVDGDNDEDAFLGVLALTMGEPGGSLQQVLDKRIVQSGEEGAFCISRYLLLDKMVFPNLHALWNNLKPEQVNISDNMIQLKPNQSVDLPQVEHQGNWYTPMLQEFTFTVEGPQITVEAYTLTQIQDGVQAWCRTTNRYTIVKGMNKSGQTTMLYQQIGDTETFHGHYIEEWVEITDAILSVIVAIIAAVLVVATDGAAAPIIGIIGALLVGLIAVSPQIIGLIINNDSPSIDLLQENIYAPIVWTDSQDFTIQSVDLNGAIRFGGSLGFESQ